MILTDGQSLRGQFVGAKDKSVTFHNDALGDLTVDWTKLRELHAHERYAVVPKSLMLRASLKASQVPKGVVDMTGQTLTVDPGNGSPKQTFVVGDVGLVQKESDFEKQMRPQSFFAAWNGTVTAGGTLVEATQKSRSFTTAINLARLIPEDTSLPSRNRTTVDFTATTGYLSQPGSPELKTSIWHADAERDQYLPQSRMFGFVQVAFDHNYSQGLSLQQNYGGGFGWTVVKREKETLDLRASVNYLKQSFQALTAGEPASPNMNLVGSVFSENYTRKFGHGATLLQGLSVTPAWNNQTAWQWAANAGFTVPVYKRLSFTTDVINNFLNDPPPGFRKNSFQFTSGLTFTL